MKSAYTKNLTIFSIFILFSVSSSAFAQWQKLIIDENMIPRCVSVNIADMNGDNEWDIIVTNGGERKIILYQNDFSQWKENIIDDNVVAPFASPGDIDGDDTLDVVACLYLERKMVWYENNLPEEWTQHIIAENTNWNDYVVVVDINNDNKLDVVSAVTTSNYNKIGDVVWYENNHPTWTPHIIESDVSGCGYIDVTDVDGDGFNDVIATLDKENKVVWYKSENIGTPFAEWRRHTIDDSLKYAWIVNSDDINKDGKMDIVATAGGPYHNGSDVVWYENPTWIKHVIDADLAGANFAEIADVDGDGRLDVIAGGFEADDVVWYRNNHPEWNKNLIDADLDGPRGITLEDLDGDGIKDVIVAALTSVVWYKNPFSPQTLEASFEFEGLTRNYEVHLPPNYQSDMPLVINLHGSLPDDAEWMMGYTRMNEIADTGGFILVYPNSTSPRWNANAGIPNIAEPDVNDVGFISALIDTLIVNYNVDTNRIYCCGLNYGGWMASELICQIGHRFAAGARVNTSLGINQADRSTLEGAFPIVLFNGTADTYLPWPEGKAGVMSGPEAVNWWVEQNECELNADAVSLPDIDPTDNCTVEKISYKNSSDETMVAFYKVLNGGLSWPGAVGNESFDKPRNNDINAGVEIWNFFKDFTRPEKYTPIEIWTPKAEMNISRKSHSSCVLDGKIYVFAGKGSSATLNSVEVYDPVQNSWTQMANMNSGRVVFSTCVYNGKILVIGGSETMLADPIASIEEYDPTTDLWSTKTNMPRARIGATATIIGDKIYIIGGINSSKTILIQQVDVLDMVSGEWTSVTSLPTPRMNLSSVSINGLIYTIGGTLGAANGYLGLDKVEVYNPNSNTWSDAASIITKRKNFAACQLDGSIYVFGGSNLDCGGILSSVEMYDPALNIWEEKTNMLSILGGPSAVQLNNKMYISGGSTTACPATPQSTMYEYAQNITRIDQEIIESNIPQNYMLSQNYPNPFNPSTTIKYQIPTSTVILSEAKNLKDFSSQAPQNDNV